MNGYKIIDVFTIPEKVGQSLRFNKFPDGQVGVNHVNISPHAFGATIKLRFNSYENLIKALATNQSLRRQGITDVKLFVPYIMSSRSDRHFSESDSFDLKIVADIINSANFSSVTTVDPHSDVTPALINNCVCVSAWDYWIRHQKIDWEEITIIAPDAGAYKRLMSDKSFPHKDRLVGALKYRNSSGEPVVTFTSNELSKTCVIIDDICDGGRTFSALAEQLKYAGAEKVILMVTHGIFSAGFDIANIDYIYTTNSYREIEDRHNLQVFDIFK